MSWSLWFIQNTNKSHIFCSYVFIDQYRVQSISKCNPLGTTAIIFSDNAHPFSLPEWRETWMGHPHSKLLITGTFELCLQQPSLHVCNFQQHFTVDRCLSCATIQKAQFDMLLET